MIIGAGAGIGGAVGKTFAAEGYTVVLCRRSDQDGLDTLTKVIEAEGGKAHGMLINAADPDSIEEAIIAVEQDIGAISVLVYNLGAQIGNRPLKQTSLKAFELGWRLGAFGLFRAAKIVCPAMVNRGDGTILVTSSTAAMRGNAGQHSHAAAMGARRMLCQSLNAEFGPQGVHVSHIVIDGAVDAPDTLGKMLGPEKFEALRQDLGTRDGLLLPQHIAQTYLHLANQPRSVWTHELDLRTWQDLPWWNS